MYYAIPCFDRVISHKKRYIGSVGGYLAGYYVVKLKYVLYKLLFLMVDGALFAAGIHHHAYFFLTDVALRLVGVYAHEPENEVCRN